MRAPSPGLLLAAFGAALFAGCTRTAGSEGAGQGLVALGGEVFVPPELHDHGPAPVAGAPPPGEPGEAAPADVDLGRIRTGFHDFGAVPFGELAVHTFRLENTDPVPVTLRAIDPSCGCTIPRVSYREPESGAEVRGVLTRTGDVLTVPPGAVAELEVRIDTRGIRVKNVDKLISIRVTSDSVNAPFLTLECHLVVDQPFHAIPEPLNLGALPVSVGGTGRLELVQAGESGALLTGVEEAPPGVLADLVPDLEAPRPHWFLDVGLEPPLPLGEVVHVVRLGTEILDDRGGSRAGAPFEVQVVARGIADVEVRPGRLHLRGTPLAGEVELVSTTGEPLRVAGTEMHGEHDAELELRAVAEEPDADGRSTTWRLTLSAAGDLPSGSITGTVVVRVQRPGHEELVQEIPYVGFLR